MTETCEPRHFGDPCVKCGMPHADVEAGACLGRPTPWGDAWTLGRLHAMCGQSRLNPEFFKEELDRRAYVGGYEGIGA